jgi:phosphoenolpyruvate carboxylase
MIEKMKTTQLWAQEQLASSHHVTKYGLDEVYTTKEQLLTDLNVIFRSLCDTDNEIEADGFLTDVIRNVSAFGVTMVALDIRQESTRHEEALDSITRYLGKGSYSQWDEDTKLGWLQQQLASRSPMLRPGAWRDHPDFFSPTAVDTLEIFSMISDQHDGSLGAYVISQCTSASDILAVLVLQHDAGVKKPLRVVPLFETLDDLNGAASSMKKLFSLPGYMGAINGKHEVCS